MNWEKVRLEDISKSIQPGPFGSQLHNSDYTDVGTPVIMPKDMVDSKLSHDNLVFVSDEHVNRLKRHRVSSGDLVVARKGDVRKCVYITKNEDGWLIGSDCLKVVLKDDICISKYIYYQLKSEYIGRWLETISIGSTMPSLNTGLLSSIELFLPPLNVQKKIADILSAYDDLIENNKKQISLLEEAAQRLYKEWFVDMRFPGHETTKIIDGVPEGWECTNVGNLLEKIPRKKHVPVFEYLSKGNIPVIDQSREFIAGYTNDEDAKIELNGPVIVFGDHTRILKLISFPFANGADGTQLILSKTKSMPQHLFYYSLLNIDLSNYHYARHFKYLKSEKIMIPSRGIAEMFEKHALVMHTMIQKLRMINLRLTEARDRLLPKLMSGEIEVKA